MYIYQENTTMRNVLYFLLVEGVDVHGRGDQESRSS